MQPEPTSPAEPQPPTYRPQTLADYRAEQRAIADADCFDRADLKSEDADERWPDPWLI